MLCKLIKTMLLGFILAPIVEANESSEILAAAVRSDSIESLSIGRSDGELSGFAASLSEPPDDMTHFWNAVTDQGIDNNGRLDATKGLLEFFERGGDLYIPDGNYWIAPAGDDSGGVYATITASVRVVCGPSARIFTTAPGLDNDMIRLSVPSNGAGLPTGGITIEWHGCLFDQSMQKTSTIVPFIAEYPPRNRGVSVTADALSINAVYNKLGKPMSGVATAAILGTTTVGGLHWQAAGGDSGLYIAGVKYVLVRNFHSTGNRDLGIYISSDAAGILPVNARVDRSTFLNTFHGVGVKRSVASANIEDNRFDNCPRAILAEHIAGQGNRNVRVNNNYIRGANIGVKLIYTSNSSITRNVIDEAGAVLADGITLEPHSGLSGILLDNVKDTLVADNVGRYLNPSIKSAYPVKREFILFSVGANNLTYDRRSIIQRNNNAVEWKSTWTGIQ